MKIEIDCSKVTTCGNDIAAYVDNFGTTINEFSTNIGEINNIWEGEDALAYINAMKDECLPLLNEIKEVFEQYGEYLQKVSKTYETLDETFATKTIEV